MRQLPKDGVEKAINILVANGIYRRRNEYEKKKTDSLSKRIRVQDAESKHIQSLCNWSVERLRPTGKKLNLEKYNWSFASVDLAILWTWASTDFGLWGSWNQSPVDTEEQL